MIREPQVKCQSFSSSADSIKLLFFVLLASNTCLPYELLFLSSFTPAHSAMPGAAKMISDHGEVLE